MTRISSHEAINHANPGQGYVCEGGEIVEWGGGDIPTQAEVDQWEADYAAWVDAHRYRAQRAAAYAAGAGSGGLGKESGVIPTIGDVLDVLIDQVEANRLAAGAARTPEFEDVMTARAAVKAAYPKP